MSDFRQSVLPYLDFVVKVLASVAIPLVIWYAGNKFAAQQKETERISVFVKHLSSENENEKLIALQVVNYLVAQNQFPRELSLVIAGIANNPKEDESVRVAASKTIDKQPDIAPPTPPAAGLVPRVFVQLCETRQRDPSQTVAKQLIAAGFEVPGGGRGELVRSCPGRTEIRYFRESERPDAERLQQLLAGEHITATLVDLSPRYGNSNAIRQRTYELWYSPVEFPAGR